MHTHTYINSHTKRSFFICRVLPPCCSLCCLFSARLSCRAKPRPVCGCVSECVRIFKRKYTWIVICYLPPSLPPPVSAPSSRCVDTAFYVAVVSFRFDSFGYCAKINIKQMSSDLFGLHFAGWGGQSKAKRCVAIYNA